eukprot:CAMPEP_0119516810 /NCGR_PEP_ID=MMETSP1344-20130328/33901_1 /TAXON_ID=236787 /ORGANISM="Florenciella parvula, Strain CCMP2471" /LENGTH=57 /DNA_ID=CAMNT_0007554345 /DNA_START=518 /DNA_END=691 /DNA_ORIENTATION=+
MSSIHIEKSVTTSATRDMVSQMMVHVFTSHIVFAALRRNAIFSTTRRMGLTVAEKST